MTTDAYSTSKQSDIRALGLRVRTVMRIGLTAVMVVALFLLLVTPGAEADSGPLQTVPHVVRSGESLWSIADTHTPDTGDVRHTMDLIREANDSPSGLLRAGDSIQVPVGQMPG